MQKKVLDDYEAEQKAEEEEDEEDQIHIVQDAHLKNKKYQKSYV